MGGGEGERLEYSVDSGNNDAFKRDDLECDNDASQISIMYTNAQSLVNKIDELRVLVNTNSPDIVIISEAWTNDSISSDYLSIGGYNIIERRDRNDTDKGRGGGLLMYVRNELYAWKEECNTTFNQCGAIMVKCKKNDAQIIAVYLSPNSTKNNDDELCEWIRGIRGNFVIIGDFNLPDIRWQSRCAGAKGRRFMETLKDRFMHQHVESETHNSGNVLDLIISNNEESVSDVAVIGKLGKSDHHILTCKFQIKTLRSNMKSQYRDFNRASRDEMRRFMQRDWEEEMKGMNVNETWSVLKRSLEIATNTYVPLRKRKPNNEPKWMDSEVKAKIWSKRVAWKEWKRTGRACDHDKYKKIEASSKKIIRNKKNSLERSIAKKRKSDPKLYYSYVNSAKRNRSRIGPLKNDDGEFVIAPKDQAQIINDFLGSVFTRSTDAPPTKQRSTNTGSLHDVEVTEERIRKLIDGLNEFSAPGPDGIPPKLVKILKDELSKPLEILFSRSIDEGSIPDDWRDAHVTAIHKKGSRADPGNYRGVSWTSVLGKLLERIVKIDLDAYIEKNGLMAKSQHGFRSGRSPMTNLVEFLNETTKWFDEGRSFDVVYLDFSKAFDVICHERIIVKLEAIGIEGKIIAWIKNWLKDRRQRVVVEGEYSDWIKVMSGVLQGSVLGGILFDVFIDDIDEATIRALIKKFADDTKLAMIVETYEDARLMQQNLDNVCAWARKWEMKFNAKKCKVIHFGRRNMRCEYSMEGEKITCDSNEKDLGVWVQDNMKPTKQCAMAANAANWALGQLNRSFHYRKADCIVPLYKTFVRPKLEHAVSAWSPWAAGDRETIENVQKRMVRMISDKRGSSYEERLENIGLTTLTERRQRGDMIETFRTLNGFNKVDKNEWFRFRDPETSRATRSTVSVSEEGQEPRRNVLAMENVRLDVRKHFFTVRVAQEWNSLPDQVRDQKSVNGFKNQYDAWKRAEKVQQQNNPRQVI